MYIKRNYGFWMTLNWSRKPFIWGTIYSAIICLSSFYLDKEIALPWNPVSVIGIAVAFYLGFKNNSSYDRTWEARKIWGGIVNSSRAFSAAIVAFVKGDDEATIKKELVFRHIAWLTALRHQLRLSRPWEHIEERIRVYFPDVSEDYNQKLNSELEMYLSKNELDSLEKATNKATQILRIQSQRLQELRDKEYFEDFRHMEFHHHITAFYEDQGKSERIKNFPFPRQYASTALWMTFVFTALVPFALLDIFRHTEGFLFWICPLISGLIIWVFFLMEKIGDYSENPFEGSYNDIPITNISRAIEIDMREMIHDTDIPEPIGEKNGFLM
ncbi:MAG: bestrophin family protein [Bacteroidota bacterium]